MQIVTKVHCCLHGRVPALQIRNQKETGGADDLQLQCPHMSFFFFCNNEQGKPRIESFVHEVRQLGNTFGKWQHALLGFRLISKLSLLLCSCGGQVWHNHTLSNMVLDLCRSNDILGVAMPDYIVTDIIFMITDLPSPLKNKYMQEQRSG